MKPGEPIRIIHDDAVYEGLLKSYTAQPRAGEVTLDVALSRVGLDPDLHYSGQAVDFGALGRGASPVATSLRHPRARTGVLKSLTDRNNKEKESAMKIANITILRDRATKSAWIYKQGPDAENGNDQYLTKDGELIERAPGDEPPLWGKMPDEELIGLYRAIRDSDEYKDLL